MDWGSTNQFLIKEHVGMFKAANNFDIFDLANGTRLLACREENLGFFTKLLRFTDYKVMTPFAIQIRDGSGQMVVEVSRGITLFRSEVEVKDGRGMLIGSFKQKLFSIGGKFAVLDKSGREVCVLSGKWTGWDFFFKKDSQELAHVTKKWSGLGKELFTSADNYVLDIHPSVPAASDTRKLIIAAVMCIDMVLKE